MPLVGAWRNRSEYCANVLEVTVVVSDPWEFVDERGSNVFTAKVRGRAEDLVLLELEGRLYVAKPRGHAEAYSLTPTTEEQARGGPPWGQAQWRGEGRALLADVQGL